MAGLPGQPWAIGGEGELKEEYWGIVIDHSLRDDQILGNLNVIAKRQVGAWGFVLISVGIDMFSPTVAVLQDNMIDIHDDCWYAHFFLGPELIIVFQDRVFAVTVDRSTWTEPIEYGIAHGIPMEQLDFHPRTVTDARAFFDAPGT